MLEKKRICLEGDKGIQQWISGKAEPPTVGTQTRTSCDHYRYWNGQSLSLTGTKAKVELPRTGMELL